MIIAGTYFREQILSSVIPAGIIGFLLMLIPLFLVLKAKNEKDDAIKLFPVIIIFIFIFNFLFGGMSMCPPYFVYPFSFFGSFALYLSLYILRKELKKKIFILSIPITLIFLMGVRVPTDIVKALKGEIHSKEEFMEKIKGKQ